MKLLFIFALIKKILDYWFICRNMIYIKLPKKKKKKYYFINIILKMYAKE